MYTLCILYKFSSCMVDLKCIVYRYIYYTMLLNGRDKIHVHVNMKFPFLVVVSKADIPTKHNIFEEHRWHISCQEIAAGQFQRDGDSTKYPQNFHSLCKFQSCEFQCWIDYFFQYTLLMAHSFTLNNTWLAGLPWKIPNGVVK